MAEARMIRAGILTSDAVNELSWPEEVFYRRLMSVVDDFGRFDARPSILRGLMYPLKLNQVSESDIVKWMNRCSETGLVSFYEVGGKAYLEIINFGQRLRIKSSKYPPPTAPKTSNPPQSAAQCSNPPPPAARREEEEEEEGEEEGEEEVPPPDFFLPEPVPPLSDLSNSNLYRKPIIPTKSSVWEYFKTRNGSKEMAKKFFDKYDATGWYLNNSPITNFAPLASKFIDNWQKNEVQETQKGMVQ